MPAVVAVVAVEHQPHGQAESEAGPSQELPAASDQTRQASSSIDLALEDLIEEAARHDVLFDEDHQGLALPFTAADLLVLLYVCPVTAT